MSFLTDFFNLTEGATEQPVCCPFLHSLPDGTTYKESHPSASVNTEKGVFHCMACNRGYDEIQFIQEICGCTLLDAHRLKEVFSTTEYLFDWDAQFSINDASKESLSKLHFSENVIKDLYIRTPPADTTGSISYPVLMFNHLLDIRTYNSKNKPKCKSRTGGMSGLIIPFDLWVDNPKITLLCAGEKDMAIARSHGFNAITLTGGEQALPRFYNFFKDRTIAILYDNDATGITGGIKLAEALLPYAKCVKNVTNFHEICKEKGEDIWDFFCKYNKTREDLIELIKSTPAFIKPITEEKPEEKPKLITLYEASLPKNYGKFVKSNIQVVAVSEAAYALPVSIVGEKKKSTGDDDTMNLGAVKIWEFNKDSPQDALELIDNTASDDAQLKTIKALLRIPLKERYVAIKILENKTVFKAYVTDYLETKADITAMEYQAYAIGCRLESGKKYLATYTIVPNPTKGQQLTMLITAIEQANDSVSNFKITPEVITNLNVIKNLEGSVKDKITLMAEKVKGLIGFNGYNQLITTIDLAYHTVLSFNFGTFQDVKGFLDTIIISESRIGKSSTADKLREVYQLGTFVSLAGNSATIPGLVGGSNKVNGTFQTRVGTIPQNHKGLIIFEEFGKSNSSVITELTDIRSSSEVRITRVSGSVTMPAAVRMISLTNPKAAADKSIKPIATYPNGISVLTELVPTAEDIARYDLILVLADKGNSTIDLAWVPETPFSNEVYQTRIRWVWSRTANQIIISEAVSNYIIQKANELNAKYSCHIKIFGTEAWKKLTRLAIAIAGYLVSTDDYMTIKVTTEHVDYAAEFLTALYDNPTFKLKEYVDTERRYTDVTDESVTLLQDLYIKHPSLVIALEETAGITKATLSAVSGLQQEELNRAVNQLVRGLFVRYTNYDITPTERFRKALARINRNTRVLRTGEEHA